jgi:hypothetical protein
MGHKLHSLNMNSSAPTSAPSQAYGPRASFLHDVKKPENKIPWRRAHRWTIFASLALHLFNLAASTVVVALLAQALSSHHKLRHIRQFSGVDSAWPKNLSLTGSIVFLAAAATNLVKSAIFLMVEVHQRIHPHSNMFLIVLTACSAVMVAIWVSACVFVEMNRQSNEDFATWACARSDAPFNQVVPFGAICNEEVSRDNCLGHFWKLADRDADRCVTACSGNSCRGYGTCHQLCHTGHPEQISSSIFMKSAPAIWENEPLSLQDKGQSRQILAVLLLTGFRAIH